MSLKDRIIQARNHAGISTNVELAERVSQVSGRTVPPQSIQFLTGGKARSDASSLTPFIAKACGVDAYWLATGEGNMHSVGEESAQYGGGPKTKHGAKALAVFREAVAGLFKAMDDLDPGSPERAIIEAEIGKRQARARGRKTQRNKGKKA